MSDLISRKALLQQLRTDKALGFDDFYETVENFPTAYDIDKVVEQISKASDHYECEEQGREDVYMVDTEIVIEIVKGAVKDDDYNCNSAHADIL